MKRALVVSLLLASAAAACDTSPLVEAVVPPRVSSETLARCADVVAQFSKWFGAATLERAMDADVASLVRLQEQGLQRHPEVADAPLMDQHAKPSDAGGVCFALADFVPAPNDGRLRFERVALGFVVGQKEWLPLDWGSRMEVRADLPEAR